jgi:hypothetical protein
MSTTRICGKAKHSEKIYIDICRIEKLKAELFEFRKESPEEFKDKLKSECPTYTCRHIQR